jgi:hypothetical protein
MGNLGNTRPVQNVHPIYLTRVLGVVAESKIRAQRYTL